MWCVFAPLGLNGLILYLISRRSTFFIFGTCLGPIKNDNFKFSQKHKPIFLIYKNSVFKCTYCLNLLSKLKKYLLQRSERLKYQKS